MAKTNRITRIVRNDDERLKHMSYLAQRSLPYTATDEDGEKVKRSTPQNSLQHKWLTEVAEQNKEHTYEQYRALCKLWFGVPILCAADAEYEAVYMADVEPLPYETKVALMTRPIDLPVTRLMDKSQMQQYLDAMYHHFVIKRGLHLTQPPIDGVYYE